MLSTIIISWLQINRKLDLVLFVLMAYSQSRWSFSLSQSLCHSVFTLLVERICSYMQTVLNWRQTWWRGLEFKIIWYKKTWKQRSRLFLPLCGKDCPWASQVLEFNGRIRAVKYYPLYRRSNWGPLKQFWCIHIYGTEYDVSQHPAGAGCYRYKAISFFIFERSLLLEI